MNQVTHMNDDIDQSIKRSHDIQRQINHWILEVPAYIGVVQPSEEEKALKEDTPDIGDSTMYNSEGVNRSSQFDDAEVDRVWQLAELAGADIDDLPLIFEDRYE